MPGCFLAGEEVVVAEHVEPPGPGGQEPGELGQEPQVLLVGGRPQQAAGQVVGGQ